MKKKMRTVVLILTFFLLNGFLTRAAEDTDNLAPVISTISIITENIQAPGTVGIEICTEANEEICAVNLVFRMIEYPEKALYFWLNQTDISCQAGKNICTMNLGNTVAAGSYQLEEIELISANEQTRKYVRSEESLVDWTEGYKTQNLTMAVNEGCQEQDMTAPELKTLDIDGKTEAGTEIKAYVGVCDESGLKKADIVYYNAETETYLYLYQKDITYDQETECYVCTYEIPKYQEAGNYDFDSIGLTDNSLYENYVNYWRKGSSLIDLNGRTVSAGNCRYLDITYENSENAASILEENLYWVISSAEIKSTVIYRGGDSEGSLWILDYNSLQTAKKQQLTLLMPDMLTESEIIIDAAEVPDDLQAETYIGFLLNDAEEDAYDISIHASCQEIPFTIRFKMDSLENISGNTFILYKIDSDGTEIPVLGPVVKDSEGYVVLRFPNGIQSQEEWNCFRLKKYDVEECTGTHQWKETVCVEEATVEQAGEIQKICEMCGKVEVQNIPKIKSVSLSSEKYVYSGYAKTPTVKVKDGNKKELVKGKDYDVIYPSSRKNVGRYYVTVEFKGNYSGSVKKYFTIVPKSVKNLTAIRYRYGNQIRISWNKSTGTTGYRIYRRKTTSSKYTYLGSTENTYYICSNLTQNAAYRFKVVPYYKNNGIQYYSSGEYATILKYTSKKGSRLSKVTNVKAARKGTCVKISWKNISSETGYQISRSTTKMGTNIVKTYKTTKGTSKSISAKKNKTYYYKVRAYRVVNKKYIYGPWSEPVKYTRK